LTLPATGLLIKFLLPTHSRNTKTRKEREEKIKITERKMYLAAAAELE
jgi:hypothetical protein